MSSMSDNGNEHEPGGGCLGGYGQPDEPASSHAHITTNRPPISAVGPAYAGPAASILSFSGNNAFASDAASGDSPDHDFPSLQGCRV